MKPEEFKNKLMNGRGRGAGAIEIGVEIEKGGGGGGKMADVEKLAPRIEALAPDQKDAMLMEAIGMIPAAKAETMIAEYESKSGEETDMGSETKTGKLEDFMNV